MKKLTVIVKPANREDVIDIMESCAVYGVMETDITGYGNQKGYRVMYRGTMSGPNVLMKCKFETVGDDKTIEVLKRLPGKEAVYRKYRGEDFYRESGRCHPRFVPPPPARAYKNKDSKKVRKAARTDRSSSTKSAERFFKVADVSGFFPPPPAL